MAGRYGRFTDAGFTDTIILRLAGSTKNSLSRLADALTSAVTPPPSAVPWIRGWKAGENYFADVVMNGVPGLRGQAGRFATPGVPKPGSAREPDFLEIGPPPKLHEVKTGRPHPGKKGAVSYLKQCEQDRWALDNGKVAEVLWHFLPGADGTLDVPQALLDCLRDKRIPFKIYPSNGSYFP